MYGTTAQVLCTRIVTITIPGFGEDAGSFLGTIQQVFGQDEKVSQMIKVKTIFRGFKQTVKLRIFLPEELGYIHGMPAYEIATVANNNSLQPCFESVAIRLAMAFEEIRGELPPEYLRDEWRIEMPIIEGGLGDSNGVFVINPLCRGPRILGVQQVARDREYGVMRSQPLLMQCK